MSLSPVARSAARTPPPCSRERPSAIYKRGSSWLVLGQARTRRLSVKGTQCGCLQSLTHKLVARVLAGSSHAAPSGCRRSPRAARLGPRRAPLPPGPLGLSEQDRGTGPPPELRRPPHQRRARVHQPGRRRAAHPLGPAGRPDLASRLGGAGLRSPTATAPGAPSGSTASATTATTS